MHHYLKGYLSLALPISAQKQVADGEVWDIVSGPDSQPGSWGGHQVFGLAYDYLGLACVTWGKRQAMTWAFLDAYCVLAVGVVDDRDKWLGADSPVDVDKLDSYLMELTK